MAQIFRPQANWIARTVLIGLPVLLFLSLALAGAFDRSQYVTDVGRAPEQPVPFSHMHHVGQLGLDCRYCHTQVEKGPVATIPPSETCMTCHSQIWRNAGVLEPVHRSYRTGQPIRWQKITKLPGFVYFDHSIHVQKGVGCVSCHGHVESMSLTQPAQPMTMEFCLGCHREPEKFLRPREEVFSQEDSKLSPEEQEKLGTILAERYGVQKKVDCVTCHR